MKQILCMKWGDKYGPDYVNKLYGMVAANLSGEFRFVCLTDNAEGIRKEVECFPCPIVDIPEPRRNLGWRKVSLWKDKLDHLNGTWLYLDLDVVVTGLLDEFFTYMPDEPYIVMQNWTQPGKGIGNTSVFRFDIGSHPYLYDNLVNNNEPIFKQFSNSQTYISKSINRIIFWPNDWCLLFKTHCIPSWPLRFFKKPDLPASAKIVAFPGVPNPHEAALGQWPSKNPAKKIYKFIRPASWIQEIWDDAEKH